jgi:hypothetical protein
MICWYRIDVPRQSSNKVLVSTNIFLKFNFGQIVATLKILGLTNQGDWDGRVVQPKFWSENMKGEDSLED